MAEEYYTVSLRHQRDVPQAVAEALERWKANHPDGTPRMLLHPDAIGRDFAAVLAEAKMLGLGVERHAFVLKTEVWIGG